MNFKRSALLGASLAVMVASSAAFATTTSVMIPSYDLLKSVHATGGYLTKDAPVSDEKTGEQMLEQVTQELSDISAALEKSRADAEEQYKQLHAHYDGVKGDSEELKAQVKKHAEEYAELTTQHQTLTQAFDAVKKSLDSPIIKGGKDLKESDTIAAIELQRRVHLNKGGHPDEFTEDMDNLVDARQYRSAVRKMMNVGKESKEKIIRDLSEGERKAFESASLDIGMFSPEMLGIEVDCNIECAELLDLYSSVSVSKSTFMFPQVEDYGAIGKYDCDAKCDAEYGPEGNISYKNGKTYDFRGVFCFQRKVLNEANYDLLSFMFRAAARSYRINRNRALINGDGINEPLGWLRGDCFTKVSTASTTFNHQDFRRFISSAPVEYGPVVATMHQNMFGYLAAALDNNGRFIFGDGMMTYSPDDVRERIRISNCLPDATEGNTRGSEAAPFTTGDFFLAAGNWEMAYASVNKRPLWMEQWEGNSSAWCVQYQFGAEDGGHVLCCPAARTLVAGA